jgi:hypothetical protein
MPDMLIDTTLDFVSPFLCQRWMPTWRALTGNDMAHASHAHGMWPFRNLAR